MKKQGQKFLSLVMAAMLLLSFGAIVSASEPVKTESSITLRQSAINPRFVALFDCGNSLTLENSLGKLYCMGYTDTYSGYKAYVQVELQELDGTWSTIKTWTHAPSSSTSATVAENYYVAKGTYQLKLTHRAYTQSNALADEFVVYSDWVQYK